jgi:hypothetical protein
MAQRFKGKSLVAVSKAAAAVGQVVLEHHCGIVVIVIAALVTSNA